MNPDPYAPPSAATVAPVPHLPLREVVAGWEKLRLIYNALLALPGIGLFFYAVKQAQMPVREVLISCICVAIGANICYFLGPLTELYLRAIIARDDSFGRGRQLLFGLGVVFSAGSFAIAYLLLRAIAAGQ